jgi:hypothetical protein
MVNSGVEVKMRYSYDVDVRGNRAGQAKARLGVESYAASNTNRKSEKENCKCEA